MSRNIFDNIDPYVNNGEDLVVDLHNFRDALMSGLKGPGKPDAVTEGGYWIDDTNEASPNYTWDFKVYAGTTAGNVTIFSINIQTGEVSFPGTGNSFDITKVSNDAVGPVLSFLKKRLSVGGQVNTGDSLGDVLFAGTDDAGAEHTSVRVRIAALENFLAGKHGSEIIIEMVDKDGSILTERVRIGDTVLSVKKAFKADGLVLSQRDEAVVATTNDTFAALAATATVVSFTGTAPFTVQGIKGDDYAKNIILRNDTSAVGTLKHNDAAAAAGNKILLPDAVDLVVPAGASVELFRTETSPAWKLKTYMPVVAPAQEPVLPSYDQTEIDGLAFEAGRMVYNTDTETAEVSLKDPGTPEFLPMMLAGLTATQYSLTAGGNIPINPLAMVSLIDVRSSAGAITLDTTAPFTKATGSFKHGQLVILRGDHNTNKVTVPAGTITTEEVTLVSGSVVGFIYSNTLAQFTVAFTHKVIKPPLNLPAFAIDWMAADVFRKSVSAAPTFTFTNLQEGKVITLAVTNTSGGALTVTLPTVRKRTDFPTSIPAGRSNVYTFTYIDGNVYAACIDDMG